MIQNLTLQQKDYAHFLPALSGFYATFIGKQRFEEYVSKTRIPHNLSHGVESLNYLNQQEGNFYYKWSLYSAGHADLDITTNNPNEDMIRNRNREETWLLGDSGGFQIGKGVWEGDWKNPSCLKASKKRQDVLRWMDAYMDYGMILDIPAWVARSKEGKKATGVTTYQEAVNATRINNDYWIKNRSGACKFLNVLQGEDHKQADDWYFQMKDYCDPKKYPNNHFNGWSMGGQNMCDIHLALKRLISLRFDGLLEKGIHDVMHFLGTSKLEWAVLLTDIQRAVRKYHNENFMITFDCASPFLATANGQIYCELETEDRKKWVYRMVPSIDNLSLSSDSTPFSKAFVREGNHTSFMDSPISIGLTAKDICIYSVGDKNKVGAIKVLKGQPELNKDGSVKLDKDGNPVIREKDSTSWDSFSYALMMGHNVWMHINAVQEANRRYDNNYYPAMLKDDKFIGINQEFKEIVNDIFSTDDRNKANQINNDYQKYLDSIIGTRGTTGKKMTSAKPTYNEYFEEE